MSRASLAARAHAKINLCLEVLGKRADGLHEVATVLQTIALADRLRFTSSDGIALRCLGMPVAADNLILRAAHLLRERTGVQRGCAIVCEKRIPVGSGLGAGSADAAATLCVLNSLWGTGLSLEDLTELAGELGADIPFAVRGGTGLATGSGRTLTPLPDAPAHWVVLIPLGCAAPGKTASMYAQLGAADWTHGSLAQRQAQAIATGRIDYAGVKSVFSAVARKRWSETQAAWELLASSGALATSVAGSGPSVFALYPSRRVALGGLARARSAGLRAQLVRFVPGAQSIPRGPYTYKGTG